MKMQPQLLKGSLSTIILKLLSEKKEMYGYEITQRVKEMTQGDLLLTEGALYPALHKLEVDGLLESEIKYLSNRSRKYYRLTPEGKKEMKSKLNELKSFMETMNLLLHLKPSY